MDEQKKRLIELLDDYGFDLELCFTCKRSRDDCLACKNDKLADYLLANGVIVPPCRIGDKLWWACDESYRIFDEDPDIGVYEEEKGVQNIVFDGANFGVLIDGDVIPFGSQSAFLSEADARDWLEKRMKEEE